MKFETFWILCIVITILITLAVGVLHDIRKSQSKWILLSYDKDVLWKNILKLVFESYIIGLVLTSLLIAGIERTSTISHIDIPIKKVLINLEEQKVYYVEDTMEGIEKPVSHVAYEDVEVPNLEATRKEFLGIHSEYIYTIKLPEDYKVNNSRVIYDKYKESEK